MKSLLSIALAMATVAATPAIAQDTQPMPSMEDARAQIERNDELLFWAFFEGCDPELASTMIHPDFRMLHDRGGIAASSGEEMLAQSRKECARRAPGGANEGYANRRLLVPGSRTVTPLGTWGVLERGTHTFLEQMVAEEGQDGVGHPAGPTWVQTGGANYIHIWQWMPEEGRFRLLESISVDHGPTINYPPKLD